MNNNYISNFFKKMIGLFQKNMFLRNIRGIMYYVDKFLLIFIKKPKQENSKKKKVLIIYNLAFGDGVIWRCSAINLRKIYPKSEYEITFLCQKGIDKLYNKDDIYDTIIPIDFNKATVNLRERFKNFKKLRQNYYDIIIDPVGISEWTTNILYTAASVGSKKIGLRDINIELFCNPKKIAKIYNQVIEIKEKNLSLIEYYNQLVNGLNKKVHVEAKLEKLKVKNTTLKLPKDYFVVFPCASVDLKKWPLERYAELTKRIYDKTKYKLVLVGTDVDKSTIDEFKKLIDVPYIDYVCKTTLDDYIDIIRKAKLLVTNDTSAYHIAVVEETKVAIISGAYTYERYVLYDFKGCEKYRRPCVVVKEKECKNCNNRCPYLKKNDKIWPCLNEIDVDYAWDKISKIL